MSKNFDSLLDREVHGPTTNVDVERLLFADLMKTDPHAPLTLKGHDIADRTLDDFLYGNRVHYLPLLDAERSDDGIIRIQDTPTNIGLMSGLGFTGSKLSDISPGQVIDFETIQTSLTFQPVETISELTEHEIAGLGARIGNLPLMRTVVIAEPSAALQIQN